MAQVLKPVPGMKPVMPHPHSKGVAIAVDSMTKSSAIATQTCNMVHTPQPTVASQHPVNNTPGILNIPASGLSVATQAMPPMVATANAATQPIPQGEAITASNSDMANTKEKTPMCLINELARFDKIQHQYTLVDEQGPAHKKTFFVKLNLGDEEYAASGPSIKKAQHAAAALALEKTKYKHPPPKNPHNGNIVNSITPTVELNALAMKRGEPAEYRPIEMQRPQNFYPPAHSMDFRGMYGQRYHYNQKYNRVFYMSLRVGQREFIGEGSTRQDARHDAARKALQILRNLPLPNQPPAKPLQEAEKEPGDVDDKDALKSEISLVHEIALKRNMSVKFEVIKESGPPHMKKFVTQCTVGDLKTEGTGNGKKVSKKDAAEKMLKELQKLPGLPASSKQPRKSPVTKKKNKNLIKVGLQKADPQYGVGINPISRLIQIQQAKKEKEPVYALVGEKGEPWRKEYTIQVTVGQNQCTGTGHNKKLAKRNAAEAMLLQLGYSRPAPQPTKPAIKSQDSQSGSGGDKKVTFIDQEGHASRQLVPGLLLMPDGTGPQSNLHPHTGHSPGYRHPVSSQYSPQTTAVIAKELLDKGSSPTAESMKGGVKPGVAPTAVRPKQQLLYLAEVLGFQVQFTDFPKGPNKSEFLTLVSLGTTPPSVSHGGGPTLEASQDSACLSALHSLSELGIDNVADKKAKDDKMAAGDSLVLKTEPEAEMGCSHGAGGDSVVSATLKVKVETP